MKEYTTCPICGSNKLKKTLLKRWSECSFVRCGGCNLIFQNPQESIKRTKERYNDDYFQYEVKNQHNFFNLVEKTLLDFDLFNIIPERSRILEVGSATGLFLKYMNEKGHDAVGVEICKESVDYGRKNYNVNLLNCTLEEAGFSDNSFDFIHFSHLIEHLNDPESFLNTVNRILKKDGYVMVTTPNSKGLFSRIYSENWRCIVTDHLFLFDKDNLKKLLLKCNFQIAGIKTWGSIPSGFKIRKVKTFFDNFVKKKNLGDVVCYLINKSV